MAKEFDYLAAARAASVKGNWRKKNRKDSPGLDPTASWYAGDAWYLFASMIESCGYPTAKFIFEKCIKEGAEIEAKKEKRAATVQRRATAAPIELPTIEEIDAADRHQISVWWKQLSDTDQDFSADEKLVIHHLAGRYKEFGGYTADFNPHRPPIKRKGARARSAVNAKLPAMFAAEKARNSRLGRERIAEIVIERHGTKHGRTVETVMRNERNWRKKNRKV
jgi:hypothetical protein